MTRMTPSEAFVETMVANGVTTTFGIMGSAFMDAMDIFAPAGIELVPVVHEQGAAHMADGYARVSGKHGVVIGQNGPGISNCVTAVAAAFWAHSPVVMITPETGTMGQGLGGFQEANQLPMFQEFVKYQGHIANENRMAEITARCFDRAMSEIGPTQLNIPRDRFYGDIDVEIPAPMVLDRGAGGKASLDAAADMLAETVEPPSEAAVARSFAELHASGFIDSPDSDEAQVTAMGNFVSALGVCADDVGTVLRDRRLPPPVGGSSRRRRRSRASHWSSPSARWCR